MSLSGAFQEGLNPGVNKVDPEVKALWDFLKNELTRYVSSKGESSGFSCTVGKIRVQPTSRFFGLITDEITDFLIQARSNQEDSILLNEMQCRVIFSAKRRGFAFQEYVYGGKTLKHLSKEDLVREIGRKLDALVL